MIAGRIEDLLSAMLSGDNDAATRLVRDIVASGLAPQDVHWRVLQPAMEMIGLAWERQLIDVADEHLATAVGEHALGAAYPQLVEARRPNGRRVLLATAEGERHVLGLRAIADLLHGAGYEVLLLGADVPTSSLADFAERLRPAAIGISVSMPAHLPAALSAATRLRAVGLPVVVGGRAAGSEAVQRVLQPASGAGALDAFSDAIAASPPARVAHESSAEAMVRAAGRGRRLREAIAETAARLARNEVDAMRAALGTPA